MMDWNIDRLNNWNINWKIDHRLTYWKIAMTDWQINWLTEPNYVSFYWLNYIMNDVKTGCESTQRLCTSSI